MQGRRRLRGGAGADEKSAAAGRLPGRPRSQGDEGTKGRKQRRRRGDEGDGGGRGARTWRGRLEEGSGGADDQSKGKGVEKGPSLSSGKKFEDLDNYLRGCSSASVSRREKRKRRLGQRAGGGDSHGGTMTTDGSSLSLAEGQEVRTGGIRGGGKRRDDGLPRPCPGMRGQKSAVTT